MRSHRRVSPRAVAPLLGLGVVAGSAGATSLLAQEELAEWIIDRRPILEIGTVEGPDAQLFTAVLDAALLPGGGVVVLDAGAVDLRYFDADGGFVTVAGREGDGPGEFRHPFGVEVVGDSVVVWDWRRRALLSWSTDGTFIRERRAEHHPTFHEGALLPDGSVLVPDYSEAVRPPSGPYRAPARLVRYTDGGAQDLGRYPHDEMLVFDQGVVRTPFASRSASAAGGDPVRIYVAEDTNIPRVRVYDENGGLVDTVSLLDTRQELSAGRWEAIVDSLTRYSSDPPRARRALEKWGEPDRGPAFETLHSDALGRLWVVSRGGPGGRYAVVYADGSPIARVELPGVERILEIGPRRILALALGPYDVQLVKVYRYEPR